MNLNYESTLILEGKDQNLTEKQQECCVTLLTVACAQEASTVVMGIPAMDWKATPLPHFTCVNFYLLPVQPLFVWVSEHLTWYPPSL